MNRKCMKLPNGQIVLNPRLHSKTLWRVAASLDGTLFFTVFYRGADFADAADALVEHCALPYVTADCVWGQLVLNPELTMLLKQIDDIIEAEDAYLSGPENEAR